MNDDEIDRMLPQDQIDFKVVSYTLDRAPWILFKSSKIENVDKRVLFLKKELKDFKQGFRKEGYTYKKDFQKSITLEIRYLEDVKKTIENNKVVPGNSQNDLSKILDHIKYNPKENTYQIIEKLLLKLQDQGTLSNYNQRDFATAALIIYNSASFKHKVSFTKWLELFCEVFNRLKTPKYKQNILEKFIYHVQKKDSVFNILESIKKK